MTNQHEEAAERDELEQPEVKDLEPDEEDADQVGGGAPRSDGGGATVGRFA